MLRESDRKDEKLLRMVKLEKELKFCKKRYSEVARKYDAKKRAEDIIGSGKIEKLNEEIKFTKRRYSEL